MDPRFEIKAKIGQGGVGTVYLAEDKNLKRRVAIKRLLKPEELDSTSPVAGEKTSGGGAADSSGILLHEATVLSSLQHPNIITVHDIGIDEDGGYLVMEYLEGKTLEQLVQAGAFDRSDFESMAVQVLEGLVAAQQAGLQHRDLKPSNIMLMWLPGGSFQVKILDFGLAKFSPKPSLQTIDQTNAIHGSIFFMAPEQFERTALDPRTDLYAVGCLYYYALTTLHPFRGTNPAEVMNSHLDHSVEPLHELRDDLPKWLCDWVMKLLARNMDDRPLNAEEAIRTLRAGFDTERTTAVTVSASPEAPRVAVAAESEAPADPIPASPEESPVVVSDHQTIVPSASKERAKEREKTIERAPLPPKALLPSVSPAAGTSEVQPPRHSPAKPSPSRTPLLAPASASASATTKTANPDKPSSASPTPKAPAAGDHGDQGLRVKKIALWLIFLSCLCILGLLALLASS